ncbi:tetratricopeptide repeat protein [Lentisalinibacter sediminis]|uniref:tetratricopeptide repeat protein n=1 Tax=Lentisalinibacter sediminis TaxID=2992237 RepID=UPI00386F6E87
MSMKRIPARRALPSLALGAALALWTAPAATQEPFPGNVPGTRTVKIQQKAEQAYQEGDYERAFRIWRKDLVEIGDKYAQYMVGYLYLTGQGTERDVARAYAWYRLAAERGHDELVSVMEELEKQLAPAELEAGVAEYERLYGKYGDRELVRRLIRLDELRLKSRTGRVGASVGAPMTVILRNGRSVDGTRYYAAIEQRLERRYRYLQGYVEFGELETLPDELDQDPPADEDGAGGPAEEAGTPD